MDTLLIRLIGPQQAWGVQSAGENRDTGREPSKSGILGLLCAALGRPRQEPLHDLNSLRMGVRVEREGRLESDYQIIQKRTWEGKTVRENNKDATSVSTRYYLSGAAFLVGLEGELALLEQLQAALLHPYWLLYLGRKAFPPSLPIYLSDGLCKGRTLEEALQFYPWLLSDSLANEETLQKIGPNVEIPTNLRIILEDAQGEISCMDSPISFKDRHFVSRRVHIGKIANPYMEMTTREA
jgi:CRISPR system Cascade subunit CasD